MRCAAWPNPSIERTSSGRLRLPPAAAHVKRWSAPALFASTFSEYTMAKGYWIVRVDIADPERYKAYTIANAKPLATYRARFLVRAGKFENPEGTSRTRNAVIEFPTYQAAVDCWHSPEYQEVLKLRLPVSTADLIVIEGYEGQQPA